MVVEVLLITLYDNEGMGVYICNARPLAETKTEPLMYSCADSGRFSIVFLHWIYDRTTVCMMVVKKEEFNLVYI